MIEYEHPFNEYTRTLLRLNDLYQRYSFFLAQDSAWDHHVALINLFELADIASRSDLKADIIKELDKQRKTLKKYYANPNIEIQQLDRVLKDIESALLALDQHLGKSTSTLLNDEWLMGIRSRTHIPGGTCSFDLPSYYAWQHLPTQKRREDVQSWFSNFLPLQRAAALILHLMRSSGSPVEVVAKNGCYQQMLTGKIFQLMRIKMTSDISVIPEMSANKYLIWIRFMRQHSTSKPQAITDTDIPFSITLCH